VFEPKRKTSSSHLVEEMTAGKNPRNFKKKGQKKKM